MIVVKLGGSLYHSDMLSCWLHALVSYSEQHTVVIVPGGGPFADQVRHAQNKYYFNDSVAHHMAIIAMKQFGLLLASLNSQCEAVSTTDLGHQPISIWLPDDSLLNEASLKPTWDITADSIALWLTQSIGASQLILVKQASVKTASIRSLSSTHMIDQAFPSLFKQQPIDVKIMHSLDHINFPNQLKLSPPLYLA